MRFTSIASGSSGNCTYVGSDNTHILIDAGTSKKRIQEGLNKLELDLDDLDAIFVTHEHVDHIGALHTILKKHNIPVVWICMIAGHLQVIVPILIMQIVINGSRCVTIALLYMSIHRRGSLIDHQETIKKKRMFFLE